MPDQAPKTLLETLALAMRQAAEEVVDPRDRAIVLRYIEDAHLRVAGASSLPARFTIGRG